MMDEFDDRDFDDGCQPIDDDEFDDFDCGLMRGGQCSQAGTEWCDFECPYGR